uniref:Uncharacterized protein n=1 Tax=Meloidogyne enterolobii TaxID=390850 RepID=A0A6V7V657_MELEN|nr:unnamed protein product [Meloidogyne enterolobii]
MNSGTRFFALFLLLVVNLSFFNEVNAWYPYRPGRSVPGQDVIAKRHVTAMDSIIKPPEQVRLVRGDYFYSP